LKGATATKAEAETAVRQRLNQWLEGTAPQVALDTAVQSYGEATITVGEATGATGMLVVEHGDAEDQDCIEANGQVWDFETARSNRQAHSRCRRSFVPVS
jgi:hypothetical protein